MSPSRQAKKVGLKNLKHLCIDSGQITDVGVAHLSRLSSLESLSLENAKLTDKALSYLAKLKRLYDVNLAGSFTDEGLKHLEGLVLLKSLTLSGNGLSIEALEELKKKLPLLAYLEAEDASPRRTPLIGRQLAELDGTGIDFKPEQARGKMILVCFWDMNQRPSRNCIIRLAKQAEQLKNKGVVVVAVQASKVDEGALNEWTKKNTIPFPVGMVQGGEDKTRFTWAVKSLPWLILTDKEHIVRTEGFSINELDEKITTLREK